MVKPAKIISVISKVAQHAICLALAMAFQSGCTGNSQQGKPFTLPSGRVVRILSIAPLHYTNGNPPSLLLRYQTDLKVSDLPALTNEADDIWKVLQIDADRGNFTSAIVSANEVPQGFIMKHSTGYNFVYNKGNDGSWHLLENQKAGVK
jgi:hypothetical protein